MHETMLAADLLAFVNGERFSTLLADPPWRFANRTGKMAPEHRRLSRYGTMTMEEIGALPVADILAPTAHLYLWVPNALLPHGLERTPGLGIHLQDERRMAQDSEGRRIGRPRCRVSISAM